MSGDVALDYQKAVDLASKGNLKKAVEILSHCVERNPKFPYNRFIVDIIENFDETVMFEQLKKEENRLLENIPEGLLAKYTRKYFKGEYVVRSGDDAIHFFIIAKGTVIITISGQKSEVPIALNFMTDGEFFGEMGIFVEGKRTANVVVISKSATLIKISKEQLEDFVKINPRFGMKIIGTLCKRLSKTNQILSDLVDAGIYTDARDVLGQGQ